VPLFHNVSSPSWPGSTTVYILDASSLIPVQGIRPFLIPSDGMNTASCKSTLALDDYILCVTYSGSIYGWPVGINSPYSAFFMSSTEYSPPMGLPLATQVQRDKSVAVYRLYDFPVSGFPVTLDRGTINGKIAWSRSWNPPKAFENMNILASAIIPSEKFNIVVAQTNFFASWQYTYELAAFDGDSGNLLWNQTVGYNNNIIANYASLLFSYPDQEGEYIVSSCKSALFCSYDIKTGSPIGTLLSYDEFWCYPNFVSGSAIGKPELVMVFCESEFVSYIAVDLIQWKVVGNSSIPNLKRIGYPSFTALKVPGYNNIIALYDSFGNSYDKSDNVTFTFLAYSP